LQLKFIAGDRTRDSGGGASIRPGLAPIATGAEYDPEETGLVGSLEKHGNPNMVTDDKEYRASPNRLLDPIVVFVVERCFELRPLLILRQIFAL